MRNVTRLLVAAGVSLTLLAAPALGAVADARPTTTVQVKIIDGGFKRKNTTITVGDTIHWVNRGAETHTTTSIDPGWDSGPLTPGSTFDHTFSTVGTFKYRCSIHPTMRGVILVNPA